MRKARENVSFFVEKMNEDKTNNEAKRPGTPSEAVLRQKITPYADEIINKLLEHMRSKNPNVSLGAANTLLKKIIPDLKSVEIGGELQADGTRRAIELFVNVGGGFIPTTLTLPTASTESTATVTATVQSPDLASESEKDIHSDNRDSEAGSS